MPFPVLHCYADFKWTGPSEPLACLLRELGARGWPVDLACMPDDPSLERTLPRTARQWGVRVLDGLRFESWPHLRANLADVKRLTRLIEQGGYGLVHCHGTWDQSLVAWTLRRMGRPIPLVRTDHGARQYRRSALDRWFYGPRFCDHLIVLADLYRAQAMERLGRDPDSVSRVRGAVDVDQWRPMDPPAGLRASLGLSEGDVSIGLVARVQPHRRFEVLIEAAQTVSRRDPRVKIVVLGRGTDKVKLFDRPVLENGLEKTVISGGYRRDDFQQVLAAFDAGLLLVPGSDGSCRAALQMAAMGKPLVVAERGVLPDIVIDGETGIVVDDTPEALAEALLEMAADADRRRQWGEAARRRMIAHFSLSRQADDVEDVYRRVVALQRAAAQRD